MATTETRTTSRVVGTSVPRKEDNKLVTGHGAVHRQHQSSRPALAVGRAQPVCARHDQERRAEGGARAGGRRRGVQRRRARGRLGGLAALRLARHGRDQDAVALPAGRSTRRGTSATASRSSSPTRGRSRRMQRSSSRSSTSRSMRSRTSAVRSTPMRRSCTTTSRPTSATCGSSTPARSSRRSPMPRSR